MRTVVGLTAAIQGRTLLLQLDGLAEPILVDPLPAKRGRALTRSFLEQGGTGSDALFAEALGPASYARITGDLVQEFDALGDYLKTWLPDACMVEPSGDVQPTARGERVRVVAAPWDGLAVRAEEVERLGLAALYWQSDAGWTALDAFLRRGADRVAATAILPLLAVRTAAGLPAAARRALRRGARQPAGC